MNSRGYLIDTNIVIGLLINDTLIIEFLKQADRHGMNIYLSTMTECEIFSGEGMEDRVSEIKFLDAQRYIAIDSKIARSAGNIRREQKRKGRKLKAPDAIIIATAAEHQLALVSRDSDMNFVQVEYGIPLIQL